MNCLRSNTGVVGSNPTQDMDVPLRLFCVCVVLCVGSGRATGSSPVQGVLPTVLGLRNWNETKAFHGCPLLQNVSNRKERERQKGFPSMGRSMRSCDAVEDENTFRQSPSLFCANGWPKLISYHVGIPCTCYYTREYQQYNDKST
jgi:hypothetical protein